MKLRRLFSRRRRRDDEQGYVILWMVIVLVLLLSVSAFAVDLVHAYVEGDRAQKAADAAALAGATVIPTDTSAGFQNSKDRALALAQANGFVPSSDVSIDPEVTGGNQMTVNISSSVPTIFAKVMGIDHLTVKRKAIAEYDAPLAMGSPANNLGDVPSCPLGIATCLSVPSNSPQHLFAEILGPDSTKRGGNPFTTNYCNPAATATDGCAGTTNNEYTGPDGGEYFYINNTSGEPLDLWVYDAGFVNTGPDCDIGGADPAADVAGYPTEVTDNWLDPAFCAQDQSQVTSGAIPVADPAHYLTTKYEVLQPDGTSSPLDNTPYGGCPATTIAGYAHPGPVWPADPTSSNPNALTGDSGVNAKYFHQWQRLCTTGGQTGEWIMHVTAPSGDGDNNFSILALHGGVPPTASQTATGDGSVYTRAVLPLLAANPSKGTESDFYLARVLPSSRPRQLTVNFFDLGDEPNLAGQPPNASTGTLKIATKNATGTFSNCEYVPPVSTYGARNPPPWPDLGPPPDPSTQFTADDDCTFTFDKPNWNARWVSVHVPIPTSYTCTTNNFLNCWIQLQILPDSNTQLSDATTWNAQMNGAPVRLVG